jgi:hypothetical protein
MDYDTIDATIMAMEHNTNPDYSFAVRAFNRNDDFVCKACQALEGVYYNEAIYQLPEPPFENCENAFLDGGCGCRCWVHGYRVLDREGKYEGVSTS